MARPRSNVPAQAAFDFTMPPREQVAPIVEPPAPVEAAPAEPDVELEEPFDLGDEARHLVRMLERMRELARPDDGIRLDMAAWPIAVDTNTRGVAELKKCIDIVWNHVHNGDVFDRCLRAWWGTLTRMEGGEAEYMEAIKGWPRPAVEACARGFAILIDHFYSDGNYSDLLGPLYMDIRSSWGGKFLGQFFTPWHLCLTMAKLNMGGLDELLAEPDRIITVSDPCVGSGAMLLAMLAEVATAYGRSAVRRVACYGQDIDMTCVLMSKIQLRMVNERFMTGLLLTANQPACDMRAEGAS